MSSRYDCSYRKIHGEKRSILNDLIQKCPNYPMVKKWVKVEEKKKHFFKPSLDCKDNHEKNLWITGKKDQLEDFVNQAIGTDPLQVYNIGSTWDGYAGQSMIVARLYQKRNMQDRIYHLKAIGDSVDRGAHTRSGVLLYSELFGIPVNSYHCIVLSTMTPEEACENVDPRYKENDLGGLKWRFDELKLN